MLIKIRPFTNSQTERDSLVRGQNVYHFGPIRIDTRFRNPPLTIYCWSINVSNQSLSTMGKKSRKSEIASEDPVTIEPQAPAEVDVAGPLTLEEAKAIGDVPESFHVKEDNEGFLKRATHIIMGNSEDEHEEEPGIQENAKSPNADPAQALEGAHDVQSSEVKENANAEAQEGDDRVKKVSFSDDEAQSHDFKEPETAHKKKSFLGFLSKKKHKSEMGEPSHGEGDSLGQVKEENAIDSGAAPVEGGEMPQAAAAAAATATATEAETDHGETAEQLDSQSPTEGKQKKKNFLSGIFHRKHKDESGHEGDDNAIQGEASTEETAGAEAAATTAAPAEAAGEGVEGVQPSPETAAESVQGETTTEAKEEDSSAKKGFFGTFFGGGSQQQDGESKQEAPAHQDEGSSAPMAGMAGVGAGAAVGAGTAETPAEGAGAAEQSAGSAAKPTAASEHRDRRKDRVYPSDDANVIKEGKVLKKGVYFGFTNFRQCRLTSDGIFQWGKVGNDWDHAKGIKLTEDTRLRTLDVKTGHPYVLKIYVGQHKPIFLLFKDSQERNSWESAFRDQIQAQVAPVPQQANEVLKSSITEDAPTVAA